MDALSGTRVRLAPMVALTGAVAIATATVVSSPPAQLAAEKAVPAVVREVKSLPVQLTSGVNFFAPYYAMPAGAGGVLVTVPLYVVTLAVDNVVKGTTQLLTNLNIDKRLAQQPTVLTHSLVFPIATGAQIALSGLLGGTYIYGQFTPVQALNFLINSVKNAIDGFVAAEKALLGVPSLTAKSAGAESTIQDVGSPAIATSTPTVTLSTAQTDIAPKPLRKQKTAEAGEAAPLDDPNGSVDAAGDTGKPDTPAADAGTVKKPAVKLPKLKLPTFKLPTLKLPTLKKSTAGATKPENASNPEADQPAKDAGSQGSSK
ncbi:hypothetical protein ACXPWS_04640 [Mycobacterium sp. BMJ-28]